MDIGRHQCCIIEHLRRVLRKGVTGSELTRWSPRGASLTPNSRFAWSAAITPPREVRRSEAPLSPPGLKKLSRSRLRPWSQLMREKAPGEASRLSSPPFPRYPSPAVLCADGWLCSSPWGPDPGYLPTTPLNQRRTKSTLPTQHNSTTVEVNPTTEQRICSTFSFTPDFGKIYYMLGLTQ